MEYVYNPDSYDYGILFKKDISQDEFVKLQVKYKESLEKVLMSVLNFKSIDPAMIKNGLNIPVLEIPDNNFYQKFSTLGSKYLFLRNNIHIERLTDEEIEEIFESLFNDEDLSKEFIMNTLDKVISEDGDTTMYGTPLLENEISSKSLVFEFAYDDKKCSLEDGKKIAKYLQVLFKQIKDILENKLNMRVEFIISKGF